MNIAIEWRWLGAKPTASTYLSATLMAHKALSLFLHLIASSSCGSACYLIFLLLLLHIYNMVYIANAVSPLDLGNVTFLAETCIA